MAKPVPTEIPSDVKARFWAKVEKREPHECWPWRGSVLSKGARGTIWFQGRTHTAPRLALIINGEDAPSADAFACHTCDNPNCVNPGHLWWGTNSENLLDASQKGRLKQNRATHCPQGHPYSGKNLLIVKGNQRRCKRCMLDYKMRCRRQDRQTGSRAHG